MATTTNKTFTARLIANPNTNKPSFTETLAVMEGALIERLRDLNASYVPASEDELKADLDSRKVVITDKVTKTIWTAWSKDFAVYYKHRKSGSTIKVDIRDAFPIQSQQPQGLQRVPGRHSYVPTQLLDKLGQDHQDWYNSTQVLWANDAVKNMAAATLDTLKLALAANNCEAVTRAGLAAKIPLVGIGITSQGIPVGIPEARLDPWVQLSVENGVVYAGAEVGPGLSPAAAKTYGDIVRARNTKMLKEKDPNYLTVVEII